MKDIIILLCCLDIALFFLILGILSLTSEIKLIGWTLKKKEEKQKMKEVDKIIEIVKEVFNEFEEGYSSNQCWCGCHEGDINECYKGTKENFIKELRKKLERK